MTLKSISKHFLLALNALSLDLQHHKALKRYVDLEDYEGLLNYLVINHKDFNKKDFKLLFYFFDGMRMDAQIGFAV